MSYENFFFSIYGGFRARVSACEGCPSGPPDRFLPTADVSHPSWVVAPPPPPTVWGVYHVGTSHQSHLTALVRLYLSHDSAVQRLVTTRANWVNPRGFFGVIYLSYTLHSYCVFCILL